MALGDKDGVTADAGSPKQCADFDERGINEKTRSPY
jgi:hypothetical protein